ncbi:hypothetical protein C8Q77DRAFT_1077973 [Trametes polyzona]|nr:hypothetical protein C8Q77DRAFT_1077973 [Trametes polyzona]
MPHTPRPRPRPSPRRLSNRQVARTVSLRPSRILPARTGLVHTQRPSGATDRRFDRALGTVRRPSGRVASALFCARSSPVACALSLPVCPTLPILHRSHTRRASVGGRPACRPPRLQRACSLGTLRTGPTSRSVNRAGCVRCSPALESNRATRRRRGPHWE